MKRRALNLLTALDQFAFCVLTLGHSYPDETISAWAWRAESRGKRWGGWVRRTIDALFWFDPDHCRTSFESEWRKAHLPDAYR